MALPAEEHVQEAGLEFRAHHVVALAHDQVHSEQAFVFIRRNFALVPVLW